MSTGCVIVTFKQLDEDFIFLSSYLIPFFSHVDNNEKASHVLSFIFKRANLDVNSCQDFENLNNKEHVLRNRIPSPSKVR